MIINAKPGNLRRKLPLGMCELNVAAYCRISSDRDEQLGSLEMQRKYYRNLISRNSNWSLVGIYADEGSGRNIIHRPAFTRMMEDCEQGKIDLILTKSVKRIGRNTVDVVASCRKLKSLGIEVFFEIERIRLLDKDSMFFITIYASFAQEESINLSENTKWGLQKSFASGNSRMASRPCYGYKRVEGRLVICQEEARIVKEIFELRQKGLSIDHIAKNLTARRIATPQGKSKWSSSVVFKILKNEKYTGDVMLGKTITKDYFANTRKANNGESDRYLIEDAHEQIIAKELFCEVNKD